MMKLDTYGKEGFKLNWPYHPDASVRYAYINAVKQTAGFTFNKSAGGWVCSGPEVILDLDRLDMWQHITTVTPDAQRRIEDFRGRLEKVLEAKYQEEQDQVYAYQKAGTKTLVLQRHGLLADEMGLGKSKQALDAVNLVGAHKVLIVATKSLTYNWLNEVNKWYPDWEDVDVLPDGIKTRAEYWQDFTNGVVIINYEKLRMNDWPFDITWDVVIFDEASRLKNTSTATWKAGKKLKTDYLWMLTGTPLEIRIEELYGIMAMLRPAVFGGFTRFRDQHLITDAWGNVIGNRNAELLKMRIGPWMIRRTKKEVLKQIPAKLYNDVFVEWSTEEAAAYEHIRKDFIEWLDEQGKSHSEANALTQMLRLQQFTSSPELIGAEGHRGSKYELLLNTLREWEGKAVVFTRFEQMAERLVDWLWAELGCEVPMIAGPIDAKKRVDIINTFNLDPTQKVLVSTDAGAYGLNITGADLIVHYDQLWNPAKMHQREDRLHRIGQVNVVNVVNLLVPETIDAGMAKALVKRQDLFNNIVEGAEEVAIQKLGSAALKKISVGQL